MYSLNYTEKATTQLEKLNKELRERILFKLEKIRIRPEAFIKRLVGDPSYSLRVGKYRIIMDIIKDKLIILVIEIGHRKNIYKK